MSCLDQIDTDARLSLLRSVFKKNYFLWVGSGFSYNFGYGSWEEVLIEISKRIQYPLEIDKGSPLKTAELLCSYANKHRDYNEYQFNSIVADSLLSIQKDVEPPQWVKKFRSFAPKNIVTTNWDNLLELIFDGLINVVVRKDKSPQISPSGRNIFKIHGDIGRPESIVVTQSQYFNFQREDTYLNRKIYTLFSEASPIFIGYSLTDPNIGFLYDEVFAHLGEEKPPAFMVVHPSVSDRTYKESRLLFENKNIHIIKAEINEFLSDLEKDFIEFQKTTDRYFLEYSTIIDRLRSIIDSIAEKKDIKNQDILRKFNNKESRHQAVKALVDLLDNQIIYQGFGKEILTPENRMSYGEIDQIINTIIVMVNEDNYPSFNIKERFYASVMSLCAKSDGVWDFYTADQPFRNILRISPGIGSNIFEERIEHIIKVLRWSAPKTIGKCWATWKVFETKLEWFSEIDIDEIIEQLSPRGNLPFQSSDIRWLEQLKIAPKCTQLQRDKITKIIEITQSNT